MMERRFSGNKLEVPGAQSHQYHFVEGESSRIVDGGIIDERYLSIYINGTELATLMFSPTQHEALALGFLYNEGVIDSLAEVAYTKLNVVGSTIDIFLNRSDFSPPRRMIITSGCSGGITTQDLLDDLPPLESDLSISPQTIYDRIRDLQSSAKLYHLVRGVHTAVIASVDYLICSAEDVGRHNAIDKVTGLALQNGTDTRDQILLSSGRISSEMLGKARRMSIPIVVSRTAPTSMAVQLAEAWDICIVGYARMGSFRVYTHAQRIQGVYTE